MNKVFETGNLTRDPEARVINAGGKETTVVSFTIAVNRRFKKRNGEWDEQTDFFDCEAWDTGAQRIAEEYQKGDAILIEGSLKNNVWEDNEGKKRTKTLIRVDRFERLGRRKERTVDAQPVAAGDVPGDVGDEHGNGDDIPF